MKMTKIVLASLLSFSLLGASTSVFADDTTANTATNFEVTGGSLTLSDATKSLDFGSVSVADLVAGNQTKTAATGFAATVSDTLGDASNGWQLTANYSPLTGADKKTTLGETLKIGNAYLKAGDTATPVYAATNADVATALKNDKGVMNVATAASDIALTVPQQGTTAQKFTGNIAWTLSAAPVNEVATTTNAVTPTTPAQ